MTTTLVFSKSDTKEIEHLLTSNGIHLVEKDPDVVVSWGGDGTLLLAEHEYPCVPKFALGKSKTCKKCIYEDASTAIEKFASVEKLPIKEEQKLLGELNGEQLPLALNDIVLRNKDQQHAIRFSVTVNGKTVACIGDGVVVSTPFGSTAYYHTITRSTFSKGMGVAFNNTITEQEPIVTEEVKIKMERGDGLITVDTLDRTWTMKTGDVLTVKLASETAKIIVL